MLKMFLYLLYDFMCGAWVLLIARNTLATILGLGAITVQK